MGVIERNVHVADHRERQRRADQDGAPPGRIHDDYGEPEADARARSAARHIENQQIGQQRAAGRGRVHRHSVNGDISTCVRVPPATP
jgi:hypothetical protein